MALGMEVGLDPGDCVRWGPSYPRTEGTPTTTQFLAHVYCGQMAGWMNMPLGTEVASYYGQLSVVISDLKLEATSHGQYLQHLNRLSLAITAHC